MPERPILDPIAAGPPCGRTGWVRIVLEEAPVAKNIVIFSDGTGQAGGLLPDETRSNVYKLYRAARVCPDTTIDPAKQVAFYDVGLGSKAAGSTIRIGWWRRIYNILSSATGLGITQNIIDCYAAIIRVWEPDDRIYLIGFSRGAYTVRCVGAALALCGIPTRMAEGAPSSATRHRPRRWRRKRSSTSISSATRSRATPTNPFVGSWRDGSGSGTPRPRRATSPGRMPTRTSSACGTRSRPSA